MMNAVQHRINVDGHLNAHGGFNFGENNRMGVATVGTSREPINSWLPLYVCDQHWQRVKVDFIFNILFTSHSFSLDIRGYFSSHEVILFIAQFTKVHVTGQAPL